MTAFTPSVFRVPQRNHPFTRTCLQQRPRPSQRWLVACSDSPNPSSLLNTLRDGNQPQQILALISLEKLPSTQAVRLMLESEILDSENRQVRLTALATLGKLGDQEQAYTLASVLLGDEDHSIRAAAASGLGSLCGSDSGAENSESKMHALQALTKAAIDDEHFIVRYASIVSAGNLADPSAIDILLPLAADVSAPALEAAAAVAALGEVIPERDVNEGMLRAVTARAGDREDFVRAAVARTLGRWLDVGDARTSLKLMRENEDKYGQSGHVKAILEDVLNNEDG